MATHAPQAPTIVTGKLLNGDLVQTELANPTVKKFRYSVANIINADFGGVEVLDPTDGTLLLYNNQLLTSEQLYPIRLLSMQERVDKLRRHIRHEVEEIDMEEKYEDRRYARTGYVNHIQEIILQAEPYGEDLPEDLHYNLIVLEGDMENEHTHKISDIQQRRYFTDPCDCLKPYMKPYIEEEAMLFTLMYEQEEDELGQATRTTRDSLAKMTDLLNKL